jgi:type VI protein secretion system component VasF
VIAARLVKLLPSQTRSVLPPLPPHKELLDLKTLAKSRMTLYVLVALIALVLATTWFRTRQPPAGPTNATHVSEVAQPTSASANNSGI